MKSQTQFAGLEMSPQTRLYEDLASALHAMAQPLTVLRGALGALSLRRPSASDSQRYFQMSYTQVERLCGLMTSMRSLLDSAQCDAVAVPTQLCDLLDSIPDHEESNPYPLFLQIREAEADCGIQVLADLDRTVEAVHAVLRALSGHFLTGGRIELAVDIRDGFAVFTMCPVDAEINRLSSIDRLHLSLAEASIRSQEGLFEYLENPFRISLKLPIIVEHSRQEVQQTSDISTM
jgi:signal transduction histidine kinase